MTRFLLAALAVSLTLSPASAAPMPAQTLRDSAEVLENLSTIRLRGIPPALLANAQGVIIIPNVIKAGFIVGGYGGHGVLLTRTAEGWGHPTFISIGGASLGLQAGLDSTDVVLVVKTRKALDRLLEGKGKMILGVDASIAAGPVGRQAVAATDGQMRAEIVSYSRSYGLFAGVALDGAGIVYDREANAEYLREVRVDQSNVRELAVDLIQRLTLMSTPLATATAPPGAILAPPVMAK